MIGISAKAEYAIRAILYLSLNENDRRPVRLDEISRKQEIPREFLVQVMALLIRSGFVGSRRGSQGGYSLKILPKEIVLKEVIEVIDGSISEFRCGDQKLSQCFGDSPCIFKPIWQKVTEDVCRNLEQINFQDLSARVKNGMKPRPRA